MMLPTRKHKSLSLPLIFASLGWLCLATQTVAQETVPATTTNQTGSDDYQLGAFIGTTDRVDDDFTYGFEFEYLPQERWSYGVILEHTSDVVGNRDATVVLGAAHFRPNGNNTRLKLTGGAGVEYRDYAGNGVRFRFGAGYDLVMEDRLTVTPRIAFDFGDGDDTVVLGATAYYRF